MASALSIMGAATSVRAQVATQSDVDDESVSAAAEPARAPIAAADGGVSVSDRATLRPEAHPPAAQGNGLLLIGLATFGIVVGVPTVSFLAADLVYGAQGQWLPVAGSIGQLVVGGFDLLSALTFLLAGEGSDLSLAIGIPLMVVAGWLIGHASVSLALGG